MYGNAFIFGHFKGWKFKLNTVDVLSVLPIITDPKDPHSGLVILCYRKNLSGKIVYFSELCLEKSYSFQAPMSGFVWKNAAIKPVGTLLQVSTGLTDKNIKLHIVTDIKLRMKIEGSTRKEME